LDNGEVIISPLKTIIFSILHFFFNQSLPKLKMLP
jgi:hypothetical protein